MAFYFVRCLVVFVLKQKTGYEMRISDWSSDVCSSDLISERASDAPMLEQVQAWAAINSGTRNLRGLADMAAELVNALSSLPGSLRLIDPEPVEQNGRA